MMESSQSGATTDAPRAIQDSLRWMEPRRERSQAELETLRPHYRTRSWLHPALEARRSPIGGWGLFTRTPLPAHEPVVIWGGELFGDAELRAGGVREDSLATLGEGLYVGSRLETPIDLCERMNHACEPNVWLIDAVTLVTRRSTLSNEELTIDYATFESDPRWEMPCGCAAASCRGVITGRDWRLPVLHARYGAHFSPYLKARWDSGMNGA